MALPIDAPTQYIALYHEPLKRLMEARDNIAKNVLEVLVMCADHLGYCFPGDAYIAELVGCRRDPTVADALHRLEMMDFIHILWSHNPRRHKPDRDIHISPLVIALHSDYREQAFEAWQNEVSLYSVTNDPYMDHLREERSYTIISPSSDHDLIDPTTEQPPRTTASNKRQEPTTTTTPAPRSDVLGGSALASDETETRDDSDDATSAEGARTEPEAQPQRRMAQAPNPPSAPPPRRAPPPQEPSRPVELIKEPLADSDAEQLAYGMNEATGRGMSLALARGLVVAYGREPCVASMLLIKKMKGVMNPAGLMRWQLERGQLDPKADSRSPYERWADYGAEN